MKESKIVADLLRDIVNADTYEIVQGIVKEVGNLTCNVEIDEGIVIYNVRLNVITTSDMGVVFTPKVGSPILIARIELGQDYQVLQCTELDKIQLRVGGLLFEIDRDKIFMNEGKQGGLVLINPLKAELTKINNNVNLIKTALTQLGGTLEALVPGTSAMLQGILSGIVSVDVSNLENSKIRQ